VCKTVALELVGQRVSAMEIIDIAKKDIRYYRTSGGGLTITGGEPMCQLKFTLAIAELARQNGVGVAIETNGTAPFEDYQKLLPLIDLFLIDYKLTDPQQHRNLTGAGNQTVLENIGRLSAASAKILLRCPIIPGINDSDKHLAAIAVLTQRQSGILGFELMPYHRLGVAKASALGQTPCEFDPPSEATKTAWEQKIISYGGKKWGGGYE